MDRPVVPLVVFGVGHWNGGWANIVLALGLGAILALFFVWRLDLAANMIGNWFVDFVANIISKLPAEVSNHCQPERLACNR
ncbi:MAG: hypothetical protein ABR611_12575 [Chthoniobacterales bacterium]